MSVGEGNNVLKNGVEVNVSGDIQYNSSTSKTRSGTFSKATVTTSTRYRATISRGKIQSVEAIRNGKVNKELKGLSDTQAAKDNDYDRLYLTVESDVK